jgi:hypothetical protein
MALVLGFFQNAVIEVQPRQLPVDKAVGTVGRDVRGCIGFGFIDCVPGQFVLFFTPLLRVFPPETTGLLLRMVDIVDRYPSFRSWHF